MRSFEGHADWVNDIVVIESLGVLASASSDATVKLWQLDSTVTTAPAPPMTFNASITRCEVCASAFGCGHTMMVALQHTDYVKALGYASQTRALCSAGLDGKLVVWDLSTFAPVRAWADEHDLPCAGVK